MLADLKQRLGGIDKVAEMTGRKEDCVPREGGGIEFVKRGDDGVPPGCIPCAVPMACTATAIV